MRGSRHLGGGNGLRRTAVLCLHRLRRWLAALEYRPERHYMRGGR